MTDRPGNASVVGLARLVVTVVSDLPHRLGVVGPGHAGHAMHTLFISDFDAPISQIAERGLESAERETYANGVRKTTFRATDGNEIGFGGDPA